MRKNGLFYVQIFPQELTLKDQITAILPDPA